MAIWTVNRYRDFVAQVPEYAMFLIDREGVAQTWNAGVGRVLGYEEAEFVGLDVARLFTPEDQAGGVPALELAEAERTGSADDDRWMQKRDGTRIWVAGRTSPVRDDAGEIVGFGKIMRDQTALRHAHDALRQSEDRYRTLLDSIDEGFCLVEVLFDGAGRPEDYRFVEVNPTFERQTGLHQALGRTARQLVPDLENVLG